MNDTFVLFGGLPGGPELIVILLIVVLLFGAQKLPKLARSTGEAMGEFQKGREEVEQELQEMRDGEGEEGTTAEPATGTSVEDGSDDAVIGEAESTTDESDTETN